MVAPIRVRRLQLKPAVNLRRPRSVPPEQAVSLSPVCLPVSPSAHFPTSSSSQFLHLEYPQLRWASGLYPE